MVKKARTGALTIEFNDGSDAVVKGAGLKWVKPILVKGKKSEYDDVEAKTLYTKALDKAKEDKAKEKEKAVKDKEKEKEKAEKEKAKSAAGEKSKGKKAATTPPEGPEIDLAKFGPPTKEVARVVKPGFLVVQKGKTYLVTKTKMLPSLDRQFTLENEKETIQISVPQSKKLSVRPPITVDSDNETPASPAARRSKTTKVTIPQEAPTEVYPQQKIPMMVLPGELLNFKGFQYVIIGSHKGTKYWRIHVIARTTNKTGWITVRRGLVEVVGKLSDDDYKKYRGDFYEKTNEIQAKKAERVKQGVQTLVDNQVQVGDAVLYKFKDGLAGVIVKEVVAYLRNVDLSLVW